MVLGLLFWLCWVCLDLLWFIAGGLGFVCWVFDNVAVMFVEFLVLGWRGLLFVVFGGLWCFLGLVFGGCFGMVFWLCGLFGIIVVGLFSLFRVLVDFGGLVASTSDCVWLGVGGLQRGLWIGVV